MANIKELTKAPTEADFEAEIHSALKKALPWINAGELRHQTRFSFQFGRTKIEIDGKLVSKAEARSDILIYRGETPLVVLELKRAGADLTDADRSQGMSYASMLSPKPPLVVVTNGKDIEILESHTGTAWCPKTPSEDELRKLFVAASKVAETSLQNAIEVLLGPSSMIWVNAMKSASSMVVDELSGEWCEPVSSPFVANFSIPRAATRLVYEELHGPRRLVLLHGPPLIGKSCTLRELVAVTTNDEDFAVLFIECDGNAGSGIIQSLANLLSNSLGWRASADDTRTWLRRVSQAGGPTLVLAVDGLSVMRDEVRRDIEELTSDAYGPKLRAVLAVDDAIVDQLILNNTGRKATALGRRAAKIPVGPLSDQEFADALHHLWTDHHVRFMEGCDSAPTYRIPWLLRCMIASRISQPEFKQGGAPLLPPLVGRELIDYVRERFQDNSELRGRFQDLALAVLRDVEDRERPDSLRLEALSTFIVRRKSLRRVVGDPEIKFLVDLGYLKPAQHDGREPVIIPQLPELLLAEMPYVITDKFIPKLAHNFDNAMEWLVRITSALPMGDIIGAQVLIDTAERAETFSLNVINYLLANRPTRETIKPGTRARMHLPGTGVVELSFQNDGTILATAKGRQQVIGPDSDGPVTISGTESWLLLSQLGGCSLYAGSGKGRIDPALFMEIGTCEMVLRRPPEGMEFSSVLTHELPGQGSVVCHKSGIVEPITMAILLLLSHEEPYVSEAWIKEAISRKSLPLLCRIDIALRELATTVSGRGWARRILSELVRPALKDFPFFVCSD